MNLLHMKYAVEVAKQGTLGKAAELLFVAQPNLSRAIKELENELGITIFDRSPKGMTLTVEGAEFIGYAKSILRQIHTVEQHYKGSAAPKQRFSISVPRATYIADAFSRFSLEIGKGTAEIFYRETNSSRTIKNILNEGYNLGIVRYAEGYDKYFQTLFEEKNLSYSLINRFRYVLVMSRNSPLAHKEELHFEDLQPYIEIAHADPYVPNLSLAEVKKEELPDNIDRRIFVFERASQFDLLKINWETFMWMSPLPESVLKLYGLVQRACPDNRKIYRDVLIHHQDYKLTALDKKFIAELNRSIGTNNYK